MATLMPRSRMPITLVLTVGVGRSSAVSVISKQSRSGRTLLDVNALSMVASKDGVPSCRADTLMRTTNGEFGCDAPQRAAWWKA